MRQQPIARGFGLCFRVFEGRDEACSELDILKLLECDMLLEETQPPDARPICRKDLRLESVFVRFSAISNRVLELCGILNLSHASILIRYRQLHWKLRGFPVRSTLIALGIACHLVR